MLNILILLVIYIIGFFISLIILHLFADCNYDEEKDYSNYDDWDSNAQAYAAWSVGWPILLLTISIKFVVCDIPLKISKFIQKLIKYE